MAGRFRQKTQKNIKKNSSQDKKTLGEKNLWWGGGLGQDKPKNFGRLVQIFQPFNPQLI